MLQNAGNSDERNRQLMEVRARSLAARLESGTATPEEIGQLRSDVAELQAARQALLASASVAAPLGAGMSHRQEPAHSSEEATPSLPTRSTEEGRTHAAASAGFQSPARLPEDFGDALRLSAGRAGSYGQAAGSSSAENLLERIARAVESLASGGRGRGAYGPRPSEVTGQVAGMLATRPLGEDRLYDSAN